MARRQRRGHGEGSVYQRKDGYWAAAVEAGRCPGGHTKRDGTICPGGERRRARIVRRAKKAVLAELDELKQQGAAGVIGRDMTIAQYSRWWLTNVKAGKVAESSFGEYKRRVDNWIAPDRYLGKIKLQKLQVEHVEQWMNQLAAGGVGATSRSDAKVCLSMMLKYAVGARARTWNPAEHVAAPKTQSKTDDALTSDEADLVLAAAAGDRLEALDVVAIKYGLRQGELLHLTWDKVDLDKAVLKVGKAKTRAGVRDLPLLAGTLEALRAHRKRQAAERLEAGPLWRDEDLVFAKADGQPIDVRRLREKWKALLEKAGVPHRRFHASRHTAATLLLEAGVPLEVVSAILGHANIQITASIYAKIRADLMRRGLAKLDDATGDQ